MEKMGAFADVKRKEELKRLTAAGRPAEHKEVQMQLLTKIMEKMEGLEKAIHAEVRATRGAESSLHLHTERSNYSRRK